MIATRAGEESKAEILGRVRTAVEGLTLDGKRYFVDVSSAPALDSRFLVERHLISRELVLGKGPRGAAFGADERVSVMVNELFVLIQPAHVQMLLHQEIEADERDQRRAALLRERLGG